VFVLNWVVLTDSSSMQICTGINMFSSFIESTDTKHHKTHKLYIVYRFVFKLNEIKFIWTAEFF